jgi:hypothetical protein
VTQGMERAPAVKEVTSANYGLARREFPVLCATQQVADFNELQHGNAGKSRYGRRFNGRLR